jgi:hypothetical protein
MPRVGFEPTIPVFERTKTVHASLWPAVELVTSSKCRKKVSWSVDGFSMLGVGNAVGTAALPRARIAPWTCSRQLWRHCGGFMETALNTKLGWNRQTHSLSWQRAQCPLIICTVIEMGAMERTRKLAVEAQFWSPIPQFMWRDWGKSRRTQDSRFTGREFPPAHSELKARDLHSLVRGNEFLNVCVPAARSLFTKCLHLLKLRTTRDELLVCFLV